jgi:hypothetical protein
MTWRAKSCGLVVESTRDSTVLHDQQKYPLILLCLFKSTDTVKAVSIVLFITITCSPSSLQRDSMVHYQTSVVAMKLIISELLFSAAAKKSPSFSRSSSSTTIITFSLTNIFYGFLNSIECYLVFRHLSIYFLNGNNFLNIFD